MPGEAKACPPERGLSRGCCLLAGWTLYPCSREDCPPCQAPAPEVFTRARGATPAKVSGTCLVNPSLDLGGLWRRRNAVGKTALALESGGSIPWQGRGWGLRWYNHNRWKFDDISQNHKRPSASLDPANPLVQRDMCTRRFSAVFVISRRLATAHAHR